MKKKIAIYLDLPELYDYPFSEERYIHSYSDVCFSLEEKGATAYIARGPHSYDGNGNFNTLFQFNSQRKLEQKLGIKVDVVFDKGDKSTFPADGVSKVNSLEIDRLCNDKSLTAQIFQDVSPKTVEVKSYEELIEASKEIDRNQLVLKPIDGFGGEGILFGDADAIVKRVAHESFAPSILQEFIDTSQGIPDVVDGLHDLRVLVLNGEIVQVSIRQPAEGELAANIKRGGSIQIVDVALIPNVASELVQKVDAYMNQFGSRFYAVDMVFDGENYKLMELNSRPGWHPRSIDVQAAELIDKIADLLLAAG